MLSARAPRRPRQVSTSPALRHVFKLDFSVRALVRRPTAVDAKHAICDSRVSVIGTFITTAVTIVKFSRSWNLCIVFCSFKRPVLRRSLGQLSLGIYAVVGWYPGSRALCALSLFA